VSEWALHALHSAVESARAHVGLPHVASCIGLASTVVLSDPPPSPRAALVVARLSGSLLGALGASPEAAAAMGAGGKAASQLAAAVRLTPTLSYDPDPAPDREPKPNPALALPLTRCAGAASSARRPSASGRRSRSSWPRHGCMSGGGSRSPSRCCRPHRRRRSADGCPRWWRTGCAPATCRCAAPRSAASASCASAAWWPTHPPRRPSCCA
jgi:hypothetical protein